MITLEEYEIMESKLINEADEGYLITDPGGCAISVILIRDYSLALIASGEDIHIKLYNKKLKLIDIVNQMLNECGGCIVGEL